MCGYIYIRLSKVQALKKKINKVVPRGGGGGGVCVKSISQGTQLEFLFTESWKQLFLHTLHTIIRRKIEVKQALFFGHILYLVSSKFLTVLLFLVCFVIKKPPRTVLE